MYRVELKVYLRFCYSYNDVISVPNVPCGVESEGLHPNLTLNLTTQFLMYRVELKEAFNRLFSVSLSSFKFLMYRVELKVHQSIVNSFSQLLLGS